MDGKDAQDEEYKRFSRRDAVIAVNSKFMYIPNLRNPRNLRLDIKMKHVQVM